MTPNTPAPQPDPIRHIRVKPSKADVAMEWLTYAAVGFAFGAYLAGGLR